jgi:CheY-like chemotaxis protein
MAETYRVIVVEDDPALAALLERLLRRRYPRMRVGTYWSGQEALVAYEQQGADLLLVDHGVPHLDGLTLTKRLRARGDGVPIIGISGDPSLRHQYLAAGATAFVSGQEVFEQIIALIEPFVPADLNG